MVLGYFRVFLRNMLKEKKSLKAESLKSEQNQSHTTWWDFNSYFFTSILFTNLRNQKSIPINIPEFWGICFLLNLLQKPQSRDTK